MSASDQPVAAAPAAATPASPAPAATPAPAASPAPAPAPAPAIPTAVKIDLGISDALRGGAEEQRNYIASKHQAIDQKERTIQTQYREAYLRKNMRDNELINALLEEARTYLSNNANTSQKKVEEAISKILNKLDLIIAGIGIRTLTFQLIQTLSEFATGDAAAKNNIQLAPKDKKALLTASEEVANYYNGNPYTNKAGYTKTLTKVLGDLKRENQFLGEYFVRVLAASPEAFEVVQGLRALKDPGAVPASSDVLLSDQIRGTIITTAKWCLIIGLMLWAATLAANDVIFRPKSFRVLNFIYAGAFFFVVLPYYLYRYLSGKAPTLFALLPLTTYRPQSMFEKIIYGMFWYEQLVDYEQFHQDDWDKRAIRESGSEKGGKGEGEGEDEGEDEGDGNNGQGENEGNNGNSNNGNNNGANMPPSAVPAVPAVPAKHGFTMATIPQKVVTGQRQSNHNLQSPASATAAPASATAAPASGSAVRGSVTAAPASAIATSESATTGPASAGSKRTLLSMNELEELPPNNGNNNNLEY